MYNTKISTSTTIRPPKTDNFTDFKFLYFHVIKIEVIIKIRNIIIDKMGADATESRNFTPSTGYRASYGTIFSKYPIAILK